MKELLAQLKRATTEGDALRSRLAVQEDKQVQLANAVSATETRALHRPIVGQQSC